MWSRRSSGAQRVDTWPRHGQDGAVALFETLFDSYAASLHRYVSSRVGGLAADDIVAETFLIAFRDRRRFDPERGQSRAWLFGIATNLMSHLQRQERRALAAAARIAQGDVRDVDDAAARAAERVDARAEVQRLAAALLDLPSRDRDVLLLTAWGGLNSVEVAEALNIPVGTVRSRLHRVRSELRAGLESAANPTAVAMQEER